LAFELHDVEALLDTFKSKPEKFEDILKHVRDINFGRSFDDYKNNLLKRVHEYYPEHRGILSKVFGCGAIFN